MILGFKRR